MAINLVFGVEEVDVARCADGLAELFAKLDNSAVEVLEVFVVAHRAVAHHEAVIAERLNFKIVVERGDALELIPVLVVDDGAEQLARLAGRADDQALAMRDKFAFRDDRHALKVFEVRRRDELVEVLEAHLVLGDQNDVLWETVALDAERAELRHLVVDLLEARDAALFEHDEELGQHLRDRDRIVGRAVVVELRELQVVGHDVELVLAELGQEILRENQRVEICRLERDAALFAACADEADIKLRIVRSERAAARKGQKRVQRVLQLRRAAQHVVRDAGQADDLRRKPALGVDKGLERVDDLAVFQNDRTDLGDGIVRDLQTRCFNVETADLSRKIAVLRAVHTDTVVDVVEKIALTAVKEFYFTLAGVPSVREALRYAVIRDGDGGHPPLDRALDDRGGVGQRVHVGHTGM